MQWPENHGPKSARPQEQPPLYPLPLLSCRCFSDGRLKCNQSGTCHGQRRSALLSVRCTTSSWWYKSDVAFPTCFSPLRTPCVVLSLELTCGRWSELRRSLPGNHLETNGSSRIRGRHRNRNPDWTIAGDRFDATKDAFFLLLLGFVVILITFITLLNVLQNYKVYKTVWFIVLMINLLPS